MTIQIDDSGWGSLIGGVVIGACRVESPRTQHAFREVPVALFQGAAFAKKLYLHVAADLALELMGELRVPKDEEVLVCTGYVLEAVRARLREEGYRVIAASIGDPLQSLVEGEFNERLRCLGIDADGRRGLDWWKAVKWLKGGDVEASEPDPQREKVAKTGWRSYRKWAYHPYSVAKAMGR